MVSEDQFQKLLEALRAGTPPSDSNKPAAPTA